jgi:AmiR/NasT family two-component response regulator
VVIEQAKGMPAEYLTMSVDDAFSLLSNYTPGNNRRLSEVASRRISRAELARWPNR